MKSFFYLCFRTARIATGLLCFLTISAAVDAAENQNFLYTRAISSPIVKTLAVQAEVSPRQSVEIQAPRDGIIAEIYAWPGDEISNGSVLARLDTSDLETEKEKLEKERNEFSAHLRRIEGLLEKKLVDSQIWDNNLKKLAQIRAELAVLDEKINRSYISAPDRGTVLWSELKAGQSVKGAEPLFWVGDPKNLWLTTKISEEYAVKLKKDDLIGVFLDEKSEPILGRVDFIGYKGPKGDKVNLYVKAARLGDLRVGHSYDILIPISVNDEMSVLPENVLTKDGYVYVINPLGLEPDKFFTIKTKADIESREQGIIRVKNIDENTYVLLNPPENIEHRTVITAFSGKENWSEAYATAVLDKTKNRSACGSGGGSCGGGSSTGGSCGQAGGVAANTQAEVQMCLVPAGLFKKPEIDKAVPPPPVPPQEPSPDGTYPMSTAPVG
ncbi:MAG: efflux RND transporter periplasmic adaptor subunit [Rhodospirillales bacterium]|nr:efflux RND transporter periplasmic adaptor subunit [Rhodospirillales bacterium]